jgi:hypothetical protein
LPLDRQLQTDPHHNVNEWDRLPVSYVTFEELLSAVKQFAQQRGFMVARQGWNMDETRSQALFGTKSTVQRGHFYCSAKFTVNSASEKNEVLISLTVYIQIRREHVCDRS